MRLKVRAWQIRAEFVRKYGSQAAAARIMTIDSTRLSVLVNGRMDPTAKELERIRDLMGQEFAEKYFPCEEVKTDEPTF
ncbi:MAG TPA: hypothetical protein VI585_25020 [Candidatus Binatia bacterium]